MFDGGRLFFFWRGRVALYAILKAMGIGSGDRVIVPSFTCVAVPNAVIYSGAEPVYVDIEPATYNVSRATIEPRVDERVKAIIVQGSFGLSPDLDPILELAASAGIPVVGDCAHGLGGSYKGRPNGTVTDAAFFSTQWSKPIAGGLGGVAFVRDDVLADRLERFVAKVPGPPLFDRLMLRGQILAHPLLEYPHFYYPLISSYRWLTQRAGLSVGSSSGPELRGTKMPARYLQGMASFQRRRWQRGLVSLAERVVRRRACASRYDDYFRNTAVALPAQPEFAEHAMLRYTVRVGDKPGLLARARAARLPLGDWFLSPLHPVRGDLTPWGYDAGECPESERACRETVNLLTDRPLREHDLKRLFDGAVAGRAR